jgi:hypothetical protein
MEFVDMLGAGGLDAEIDVGGHTGTPLWWAARRVLDCTSTSAQTAGAVELATLLVQKGADVNAVGTEANGTDSTPLCWLALAVSDGRAGAAALARLLVEQGANVNAVGTCRDGEDECAALWWAARAVCDLRAGGLELATLLVEKGADVKVVGTYGDGKESTPLWWAGAYTRPLLSST